MATRAKRICTKPGCYALTDSGSRCPDHPKKTSGWTKEYDHARGSRTERGYSNKWVKASKNYLKANPLCVNCKSKRIVRPATLVDHIAPHKNDNSLFWDVKNWQGLCIPCHAVKTGEGR